MQCERCARPLKNIHNQQYGYCAACDCYRFPTDLASSVDPIVSLDGPVEARCPKCDQALTLGVIHDRWKICFCNKCRGYLIESGNLEVMAHHLRATYGGEDDAPSPIDPAELECQRNCPACLGNFDTHPYFGPGNVVIDSCHRCKVTWLDHGELATIMRAPGKRPDPDSCPLVPTYTHVPTDAVAESIAATTKFVAETAFRFTLLN